MGWDRAQKASRCPVRHWSLPCRRALPNKQGASVNLPDTPADAVVHEAPPLLRMYSCARLHGLDLRYCGSGEAVKTHSRLRCNRHPDWLPGFLCRSMRRKSMIGGHDANKEAPCEWPDHLDSDRIAPGVTSGARSCESLRTARVSSIRFPRCSTSLPPEGSRSSPRTACPGRSVLARMLVLMFCAQSAIGITNDYFDRELDAATKPWKPVAAGLISPSALCSPPCLCSSRRCTLGLRWASGVSCWRCRLACGLAYDVRLKRTFFSAVPVHDRDSGAPALGMAHAG